MTAKRITRTKRVSPMPVITLVKFTDINDGEMFTVNNYPGDMLYAKKRAGWAQQVDADGPTGWRYFQPYDKVFRCEVVSV